MGRNLVVWPSFETRRFATLQDEDSDAVELAQSRKSGYRFSEKDMRDRKNLERIPVHLNRDALWFSPQYGRTSPDRANSRAQKQNGRTFVQPLRRNTLKHPANSEGDDISFEMASEKKNYFFFLPFFFFFIAMVVFLW